MYFFYGFYSDYIEVNCLLYVQIMVSTNHKVCTLEHLQHRFSSLSIEYYY